MSTTGTEKRRRVLIVEDSPAMRQLLTLAVARSPGLEIDQAEDGMAALKARRSSSPSTSRTR
jgi:DNA-binding response OmpR family regulator